MVKNTLIGQKRDRKVPAWHKDFVTDGSCSDSFFETADKPCRKKRKSASACDEATLSQLNISNMELSNYRASVVDKPELVEVKKVFLLNDFEGEGLFAKQAISEGTCIGLYTGREFTREECDSYMETSSIANNHYQMEIGKKVIDAQFEGNFTRYVNFSDVQDNLEFVEGKLKGESVVRVLALRDIAVGEQLLIDYNHYNKQASTDYLFLNPEDNDESLEDFVSRHKTSYRALILDGAIEQLNLKKGQRILVTDLLNALLCGDAVTKAMLAQAHLPLVLVSEQQEVLSNQQNDTFSPLMVSSALGREGVVAQLITSGVRLSRQQSVSGKNALIFALDNKQVAVMCSLIRGGATVIVHDRHDNSFLHLAINTLHSDELAQIFDAIKDSDIEIEALFDYVNQNDDDVVCLCLRKQKLDHLAVMIAAYPDFFKDNFNKGAKRERQSYKSHFSTLLASFTSQEQQEELLKISTDFAPYLPSLASPGLGL